MMAAPLSEVPAQRISEQLMQTFDAFAVAYNNVRTPGIPTPVQTMWPPNEQFFGHRAEVDRWSVTEAVTGHPVLRYYRATLDCSPMQVHDVPARFADHRVIGAWLEIGSSWGTPSQVAVPLHFGPNDHRSFVLGRVDPFSPGELELIGVLQRLLVGIDRQVTALRGAAHPAHAWAAAESARLTVRELTVLEQVASGLTAAAAGRSLGISPSTVHKHLENRLHQARRARPAQRRAPGPAAGPAAGPNGRPAATRLIIRIRRTAPRRHPGPDAPRARPRAAAGCPR
jgi:DNA-binding CsgD family transcriptional regulator